VLPLALIFGTTVLAHSAFNGTRLTISLNALHLGSSPLVVGMMMSLFALLPMLLGVSAGRLVDRIGLRLPLLASIAIVTVSIALPALVPGVMSLYFAAAGVGTGFMLFHIGVQHAVGEGSAVQDRKVNFGCSRSPSRSRTSSGRRSRAWRSTSSGTRRPSCCLRACRSRRRC